MFDQFVESKKSSKICIYFSIFLLLFRFVLLIEETRVIRFNYHINPWRCGDSWIDAAIRTTIFIYVFSK